MTIQMPAARLGIVMLLLLVSGAISQSPTLARDLLLEGKCTIPETASTFAQCTLINDGRSITVTTGRSQSLLLKLFLADLLLAGRLTPEFERNSPRLQAAVGRSLSEIGTGLGDAQNSSNVRAVQFNRDGIIQTLIFIANRQVKNIGEISSLVPEQQLNQQADSDELAPSDARSILASFEREFERCQTLYEALMFEEADRVLDMATAKVKLFKEQYGNRSGAQAISNVLNSQITQLQRLRDYKAYDRYIEEQEAERDYNEAQRRIAELERQRREHQYKMAVEYRRSLEATARNWYPYWGIVRSTNIYIIR
jgi:hypothetical protein